MNLKLSFVRLKTRQLTKLLLFMKLTSFLLLISLVHASGNGLAQKINARVQNKPLEQIFKLIEKQTSYVFFYDIENIKATKANLSVTNATISEALNACLGNKQLTYHIVDNNIVISRKDVPNSSAGLQHDFNAQMQIMGNVRDTLGAALPGVSIRLKGTTIGTMSDKDGAYTISVPRNDAVLTFSFLGYVTKELSPGNRTTLDVILNEDKQALNEVVVVGYGSQSKAKVTGAISTVKMDEVLGDRPVSTVSSLLQGVVPGLQVNIGSGQPGASTSINVRGATGLNTSGNAINTAGPLILVDNVPFNGGLNLIDPNDIETVTTLKDAGSAAIYGGRSAFGVILITTKRD